MSEKDKFGSVASSSGCDEIVDFIEKPKDEVRPARDLREVLVYLAVRAGKLEHDTQRVPVTVLADRVVVSCMIWLPCGYVTQLGVHLNWDALHHMTDGELEVALNRLIKLAGEDANRHTTKHLKGKEHD